MLFCTYDTFAQQASKPIDPCREPVVALYDANQLKIPTGALPHGKLTVFVRNHPNCNKHFTFKAEKMNLYLVGGVRPLAQAQIKGNSFDFSKWQQLYQSADRIVFEIIEVSYTYNKGEETGSFPGGVVKNWTFKGK